MKIYLYELSEDAKELHFTEKDEWLSEAVQGIEETKTQNPAHYNADFELRKLQEVVFLKGKMSLDFGLCCSRCANSFDGRLQSQFETMYSRESSLSQKSLNSGVAYSEPTGATEDDLEMEILEKDYIELGDVVREQVYLKIPFQPLCRTDCKGLCPTCGQDQNTHPCQCHRLKSTALANALKNVVIKE